MVNIYNSKKTCCVTSLDLRNSRVQNPMSTEHQIIRLKLLFKNGREIVDVWLEISR